MEAVARFDTWPGGSAFGQQRRPYGSAHVMVSPYDMIKDHGDAVQL
jgi:hypothetical protein